MMHDVSSTFDDNFDARTLAIGRDIFKRVRRASGRFSPRNWVDERLMAFSMRDEQVKAQLFRFVDVLPVLRTPKQINGHLREYLALTGDRLAPPLRAAVRWMPQEGLLGSWLARATDLNARRMARKFIAATDLDEAVAAVKEMRRSRLAFTVDVLGEAVVSEREAEHHLDLYLELVSGLASRLADLSTDTLLDTDHNGAIPRVNVSVKLSSLFSQFDPMDPVRTSDAVRKRLRPVLRVARANGVFVNVDMEQYSFKATTIRIFKDVLSEDEFVDWADAGIAIQAYLTDSGEDLRSLCDWAGRRATPVSVRLVKGAYWDYETVMARQNGWPIPVYTNKFATDANYERQANFLLEHHDTLRSALATHNIRSIASILANAERLKLPARSYEFQMLYGMAEPIKAALVGMGHRVRVYTPYGQLLPGMAYLVRRLLENTSNESFLRAGFLEHVPEEKLLMNPGTLVTTIVASTRQVRGGRHVKPTGFVVEPVTDFSRPEAQEAMRAAIAAFRRNLGRTYPLVIGGERINTATTLASRDPSEPSRIVGYSASATKQNAADAIAAAKHAFETWRDTTPRDRADVLFRTANILRERRFALCAVEVFECAKPWREADADLAEAIDFCEFYAHEMLRLAEPRHRDVPGESNFMFYEPRGVTVVIAPWNFPLAILCGMVAAAVVTGNTAVMKPAEQSPVIAACLMDAFEAAGLPAGVVNYLPGVGEDIGPVLTDHPDVAVIAFTGSRAVGLSINASASRTPEGQEHVKRVITEMGGKNAIIVDDDADIDEAIVGTIQSAFGYAGQKCSACSRVIVHENVYDAFLARLVEAARSLRVGPAEDPSTVVPAVIDSEARDRIVATIEEAKKTNRLAYGTDLGALSAAGYYVGPHIFADVAPDSPLALQEIFGPVLAVMKATSLDHALKIANGTAYALTGGIYSRSPANIETARRKFRVGNLYINRKITGAVVDRQPFGGFKLSGIGSKAGGPDYLLQFMVPRVVTENTLRRGFATDE